MHALNEWFRVAGKNRRVALIVILWGLVLPPLASGQVEGSVSGTVTDIAGGVIPGTAVTIRNEETGAVRKVVTDEAGHYSAPALPIGRYEIKAEKPGFKAGLRTGVALAVGEHAVFDLTLPLGDVKQAVTVVEAGPIVNTGTEPTSGLVGERQVKDLPLNGRSYDQLLTLNPGIVNYTSQRSGGVGASNSAVGNMFAVSGRRPQESIFLLNGIEYTSASEINLTPGGASGELLGVDAVREFNVLGDAYGAEYGKRPGAQVAIVTASGTNQFHGSAYEFLRNSALDARNFFDRGGIPPFRRGDFGGSLGGPLRTDKAFFFGNYEGFRQHLALSDVTLVPDNNARIGILPGSDGTPVNVGVAPAVAPLFSLWPAPNGPEIGNGVALAFSHPLQIVREDFGTARLDHTFSDRDLLFGVYTLDDSADRTPSSNPLSLLIESLREQVLSLEETHVFSGGALNNARFGFSRAGYFFTGQTIPDVPGFIQGRPVGAIVIGGGTASNAATQITAAGTNVGSNLLAARNLFTYEDRITVSRGAHQWIGGIWLERIQANDSFAQAQFGQASFGSLTSFLQGAVGTFTAVPTPTPLGWRSLEGAVYVEDSIKWRPNLQVRLGLRDEWTTGWNEAHGRGSNYLFGSDGVIGTEPRIAGSVFTANRAQSLPGPRAGLAWDPFGKGRTVIHAGFGIHYGLLDNLSFRLDQNGPFNTTLSLKNVAVSSLHIVPGSPLPPGGRISPAGVEPNMRTPTVEVYSFKVEQQITPETRITIGYTGSHGYHEILTLDANEPIPTICPAAPCPAGLPAGTIYYPPGAPLANPILANTTSWFARGDSSYNALEVDLNRRFSSGLGFRAAYTFSKSLDDGATLISSVAANSPGFVMFPLNPKLDWSLSTFDVRHVAVVNTTYELPLGRGKWLLKNAEGWKGKLVEGWTLSGIETIQSGFPFTPQLGFNPSNNGDTRNPVRPSRNPDFRRKIILGSPERYFDPNAFVVPPGGTYGDVGRDTLVGPGLATLDLSLMKKSPLSEKVSLQLRGEFFNLLNRANFNTPNPVVFASGSIAPLQTAGVITSTSTTARQIQFGLKLTW